MFEIEILKRVLDDYGYFLIIVMLFFFKVNIEKQWEKSMFVKISL